MKTAVDGVQAAQGLARSEKIYSVLRANPHRSDLVRDFFVLAMFDELISRDLRVDMYRFVWTSQETSGDVETTTERARHIVEFETFGNPLLSGDFIAWQSRLKDGLIDPEIFGYVMQLSYQWSGVDIPRAKKILQEAYDRLGQEFLEKIESFAWESMQATDHFGGKVSWVLNQT